MTYAESTNKTQTYDGYTAITNVNTSTNITFLTKQEAHQLLNEVKAGIHHHPLRVTQALIATGDWCE